MAEVLHFPVSPSTASYSSPHSSSSSATSFFSCAPTSLSSTSCPNSTLLFGAHHFQRISVSDFSYESSCNSHSRVGDFDYEEEEEEEDEEEQLEEEKEEKEREGLSLLALLVGIFRKSLVSCKSDPNPGELCTMDISRPTNVRHVAHVTFDRFNGFLGLPDEFKPEVPRRAPSASATVFGVSTESMQLSYDSRGNCVPTILLLMQNCLYALGGLQAEGIFRITGENSEEEAVREQLNRGVIPEGVDVHCLAGLIKAWFRELPTGVLDSLSAEHVLRCETEEEYVELVRLLPSMEGCLLDWAVNLMADVVQHEHLNKMNSRNVAMVFAPNMTQMADPLTALMYAVQVMNLLKTLIERNLREREDFVAEPTPASRLEPSDESGHQSPSQSFAHNINEDDEEDSDEIEKAYVPETRFTETVRDSTPSNKVWSYENLFGNRDKSSVDLAQRFNLGRSKLGRSREYCLKNQGRKTSLQRQVELAAKPIGKTRGISNLSRLDSRTERIEAWR